MNYKKQIASARALNKNFPVENVILMCGLIPIVSYHTWQDWKGNKLKISNESIRVITAKKQDDANYRDLYDQAHPVFYMPKSYWGVVVNFQNKDQVIGLIGTDGMLRTSFFKEKKWDKNISPLILGKSFLEIIGTKFLEEEVKKTNKIKSLSSNFPEVSEIYFGNIEGLKKEVEVINFVELR